MTVARSRIEAARAALGDRAMRRLAIMLLAATALAAAGMLDRAVYVERGTMETERVLPLAGKLDDEAPYFSVILVPGEGRRP